MNKTSLITFALVGTLAFASLGCNSDKEKKRMCKAMDQAAWDMSELSLSLNHFTSRDMRERDLRFECKKIREIERRLHTLKVDGETYKGYGHMVRKYMRVARDHEAKGNLDGLTSSLQEMAHGLEELKKFLPLVCQGTETAVGRQEYTQRYAYQPTAIPSAKAFSLVQRAKDSAAEIEAILNAGRYILPQVCTGDHLDFDRRVRPPRSQNSPAEYQRKTKQLNDDQINKAADELLEEIRRKRESGELPNSILPPLPEGSDRDSAPSQPSAPEGTSGQANV